MISFAYEGLIWAVDYFKPHDNCKFMSYAYKCILGKYLSGCYSAHASIRRGDIMLRLEKWRQKNGMLGQKTEEEKFCRETGISEVSLDIAIKSTSVKCFSDLESRDSEKRREVAETNDPDHADVLHAKEMVKLALKYIHPDHRDCVKLRYLDGLNLEEIGRVKGISRERVRQIVNTGLRKAREQFEKSGLTEEKIF